MTKDSKIPNKAVVKVVFESLIRLVRINLNLNPIGNSWTSVLQVIKIYYSSNTYVVCLKSIIAASLTQVGCIRFITLHNLQPR